jgi:hypothetical protein
VTFAALAAARIGEPTAAAYLKALQSLAARKLVVITGNIAHVTDRGKAVRTKLLAGD